ncbi:MAG: alpha/beta fold hydrolase [Thermoplasmatota archaeon]
MVHTETFGEAKEGHLILVHGLGEHYRRHHRLIDKADKNGYKVHTFDWPGHGKSEGPQGHARIEKTMDIIDKLIEDIDGKPFLFGHSLGGLTVLRYAEENPDKIKSVISSSPALRKSEDLPFVFVKLVSFLSYILPKKTISNSLNLKDITRSEKEREKYREDDMVHDKISLSLLRDLLKNVEIAHDKKDKIRCPILLLAGTKDKICPIEGSEQFIEDIDLEKDKKLKKYEDAHHEIFNDPEWKDEFHDEIIEWMNNHS